METDFEAIRGGLQQLRLIPIDAGNLAAKSRQYRLNPPLTEEQVQSFEAEYGIVLPPDYRAFLKQLGNGGAGPGYGLEMLGQTNGVAWCELPGLVGDLTRPFPYTDAWNAGPIDGSQPVDEQYRQQDEYWSSRHVTGAIPICHHGCNLRTCLIVTGPETGNMWFDDRADWNGLYPDKTSGRDRLMFFEWYRLWLDESLLKARRRRVEPLRD